MDNLGIFLSQKYDFKRKEVLGLSFTNLYGMTEGGIKFSILVEYLDKDSLRGVEIRAKIGERVAYTRIELTQLTGMTHSLNIVFDEAIRRAKRRLLNTT